MEAAAMPQPVLTNLQRELLKTFSYNLSEDELLVIRQFIAEYLMEKAIAEADQVWVEKQYSHETMQAWLNEKMRSRESRP